MKMFSIISSYTFIEQENNRFYDSLMFMYSGLSCFMYKTHWALKNMKIVGGNGRPTRLLCSTFLLYAATGATHIDALQQGNNARTHTRHKHEHFGCCEFYTRYCRCMYRVEYFACSHIHEHFSNWWMDDNDASESHLIGVSLSGMFRWIDCIVSYMSFCHMAYIVFQLKNQR